MPAPFLPPIAARVPSPFKVTTELDETSMPDAYCPLAARMLSPLRTTVQAELEIAMAEANLASCATSVNFCKVRFLALPSATTRRNVQFEEMPETVESLLMVSAFVPVL